MRELFTRRPAALHAALATFLAALPFQAHASDWANVSQSGDWNTASNWSPATVPNDSTDSVTLGNGTYSVTLDTSPVIGSLLVGSGVSFATDAGQSLSVNGSFGNAGSFSFDSGSGSSLTVMGDVANSGILATGATGGGGNTITVDGSLSNTGSLDLDQGGDVVNCQSLANIGLMNIAAGTTVNLTGGTGVTSVPFGNELFIAGQINVVHAGVSTSALASLSNVGGEVQIENGLTYTITPSGGTLTILAPPQAADKQTNLDVENGSTATLNGDVSNSGTVATGLYGTGHNTLTVTGSFTNAGNLTVAGNGDVFDTPVLHSTGTLTIGSGATLNITGGGSGITAINIYSAVVLGGAFNVINNGVVSSALATLNSVDGSATFQSGISETITPAGGTLTTSNTNGFEGDFRVQQGSTVTINGNFNNAGYLATGSAGPGASTLSINGVLNNSSSMLVGQSGDVLNVAALNNTGFVQVNSGATVDITGGGAGFTSIPASTAVCDDGTIEVTNGRSVTSAFASLTNLSGLLELGNGQTVTDTPVGGTLTLSSSNQLSLANGSGLAVNGTIVDDSSRISIAASPAGKMPSSLTVTGTFTSNGCEFDLAGGSIAAPTLVNAGGITITGNGLFLVGSGDSYGGGGYEQLANGTLDEVVGPQAYEDYIEVDDGTIRLDGTLEISLVNGYVPTFGELVPLFFGGASIIGEFSNVENDTFPGGHWNVVYDGTAVSLQAVPEPTTLCLFSCFCVAVLTRRERRSTVGPI